MEQENNELVELQKKADEYLNNWKRAAADLINYKKEEMERMDKLVQYSKEDLLEKFLPIIDSIYMAEKSIAGSDLAIAGGIEAIKKQISEFLKKEGIEEVAVAGQPFNPETMESVGEAEQIEEVQKGYVINGRVLRPAKVKVSK